MFFFSPVPQTNHLQHPENRQWGFKGALLVSLILILLPACSVRPDKAYFKDEGSWVVKKKFADGTERESQSRFMVTEFAESGCPKVPAQLYGSLAQIDEFKPKTVLVYVHGWHNDSSPDCGADEGKDMRDLEGLIGKMGKKTDKVLAIYVAWRGESLSFPFNWFTLNGRRDVARKIGESVELQKFLGDVAAAGRKNNANVVFTGHSLGAALLEKSAKAMILAAPVKDRAGRPDDSRLPHLFLLANSAELATVSIEQIESINKSSLGRADPESMKLIAPRVLAVTSSRDLANLIAQPLNNYLLHPILSLRSLGSGFAGSMGFSKAALTHRVYHQETHPVVKKAGETDEEAQVRTAVEATLDPAFLLPTKSKSLAKYRIVPITGVERIPGYWNIKAPGVLIGGHNDVYNDKFLTAAVTWFRMANHNSKAFPDDLPQMLAGLNKELKNHPPGSSSFKGRLPLRTQWIMGAALRMPYNKKTFGYLLTQLEGSHGEIIEELETPLTKPEYHAAIVKEYRVNLFSILKYTHSADKVWASETSLINRLKALMAKQDLWNALEDSDGTKREGVSKKLTDTNLKAFYRFLTKHGINKA